MSRFHLVICNSTLVVELSRYPYGVVAGDLDSPFGHAVL